MPTDDLETPEYVMFYDRDGTEIRMDEYEQVRQTEGKRIMRTKVNEYWVSTVWLGVNMNLDAAHPFIFETMIFLYDAQGIYTRRYATEEAAGRGHLEVLDALRNGWDPEDQYEIEDFTRKQIDG
jgi:hypothetical protein